MAGLLAAQMLRRHNPVVCEAQASLPDNHGALLRFRTDAVARATGIPFRRVTVYKAVRDSNGYIRNTPTIQDANRYAQRVTGKAVERSILNLSPGERYIAPDNFMDQLARGAHIEYKTALVRGVMSEEPTARPAISTIPMPSLMKIVGWDNFPAFEFRPIWSVRATILTPVTDLYQTIYYPWEGVQTPFYRASLTGGIVTIEYMGDKPETPEADVDHVLWDFGLRQFTFSNVLMKEQFYGKILPTDEKIRRTFILGMTDTYNLYSVGRFATWRQILLDDVVNDVNVVARFIEERDHYQRHLVGR